MIMKINLEIKPKEWLYMAVAFVVIFLLLSGDTAEAIRLVYAILTKR